MKWISLAIQDERQIIIELFFMISVVQSVTQADALYVSPDVSASIFYKGSHI
jgi:hypothetical protein